MCSAGGSVRARVYLPEMGECLQCNWGSEDYQLLEQQVPCHAVTTAPAERKVRYRKRLNGSKRSASGERR